MDKQSGVYIITNTVNGNRYIGSSTDLRGRWIQHRSELRHNHHANVHLQGAWNMYGESAFEFSVLLLCSEGDTFLNEQQCLDSMKPEYNICTSVVACMLGRDFTEEHRHKMSIAKKGKPLSEEHKRNMSEAHKNRPPVSEETKLKISKANKGVIITEEQRLKLSKAKTGVAWSEERRLASIGKHQSEETKRNMSKAHKGKPWSEARRQAEERRLRGSKQ